MGESGVSMRMTLKADEFIIPLRDLAEAFRLAWARPVPWQPASWWATSRRAS